MRELHRCSSWAECVGAASPCDTQLCTSQFFGWRVCLLLYNFAFNCNSSSALRSCEAEPEATFGLPSFFHNNWLSAHFLRVYLGWWHCPQFTAMCLIGLLSYCCFSNDLNNWKKVRSRREVTQRDTQLGRLTGGRGNQHGTYVVFWNFYLFRVKDVRLKSASVDGHLDSALTPCFNTEYCVCMSLGDSVSTLQLTVLTCSLWQSSVKSANSNTTSVNTTKQHLHKGLLLHIKFLTSAPLGWIQTAILKVIERILLSKKHSGEN